MSSIMVLESYNSLWDIDESMIDSKGIVCMLIRGTPSTGNSVLGSYFYKLRIKQGKFDLVYQSEAKHQQTFYAKDGGVFQAGTTHDAFEAELGCKDTI